MIGWLRNVLGLVAQPKPLTLWEHFLRHRVECHSLGVVDRFERFRQL